MRPPNFEILKHITNRKDAVALKVWQDLYYLFMYEKFFRPNRRQKRWLHKLKGKGLVTFNIYSLQWRTTAKYSDIWKKIHNW